MPIAKDPRFDPDLEFLNSRCGLAEYHNKRIASAQTPEERRQREKDKAYDLYVTNPSRESDA